MTGPGEQCVQTGAAVLARVHVAGLVQLGLGRRVHRHAEGIDKVEALFLQGADVFAEEGEHQGLLGLEHLQAQERDPADADPDHAKNKAGDHPADSSGEAVIDAQDHQGDPGKVQQADQQQHGHAVFLIVEHDFFHRSRLLFL